MTFNPLRNAWLSGEYTVNGWLSMPSPVSGEAMAQGGWDSLTADLQHGMVDYQAAVGLMQVAATRGVPVMGSRAATADAVSTAARTNEVQ